MQRKKLGRNLFGVGVAMQILKILLKNELSGLLLMNNMFDTKKGKAKNPALMALGAVVFGVGLMGLSGLYSYLLAVSLIQLNAVFILPVAMFVAGSLVVFFYCALRSSGVLLPQMTMICF
ncbi:MAG: hypothetical protein RR011_03285 [Oscillospiraceae bacterium]